MKISCTFWESKLGSQQHSTHSRCRELNWTVIVQWHDSNLWLMALTSFSLENSQFLSCEDKIALSCLDVTKFSTTMSKLRQYDASEVTTSNLTWKIQILYGYVLTSKNNISQCCFISYWQTFSHNCLFIFTMRIPYCPDCVYSGHLSQA